MSTHLQNRRRSSRSTHTRASSSKQRLSTEVVSVGAEQYVTKKHTFAYSGPVGHGTVNEAPEKESKTEELLKPRILLEDPLPRLMVLCAESGMGKTYVAEKIMRDAKDAGRKVFSCSYPSNFDSSVAAKFVRRCRDIRVRAEPDRQPLLVVDEIAPADEAEVVSEARAIERLVSQGVQVVICLRPEAEQLAEELHGAVRYGADELLFRGDESSTVFDYTAGIPALVMGYRGDAAMGEKDVPGPRYMTAMRALVAQSLRPGLMSEELRVRLAMILLGHANLEDLALVAGRCDTEQLLWLERDAPLFGVNAHQGTCCCHGLCQETVLEGCLGPLQGIAATMPDLVMRACGVMATSGDVRRSALVCRLCASERDFTAVCVTWGVAYVGIGEATLVDEALHSVESDARPQQTRYLLSKAAAACMTGTAREVDDAFEDLARVKLSTTAESRLYHVVRLYGACRDILRGPRELSVNLTSDPADSMSLACLDHLRAAHLLIAGKFSEAYSTISNEMLVGEPSNLPEAFLCDDLMLALALSGGIADAKERHLFACAESFFARPSLRGLKTYHDALVAAQAILMSDSCDTDALVEGAGRAERYGDTFFQVLCLAIAAVADIRLKALSRAHVRANKAASMARTLGSSYLASAAELVDALSLELLGESGAFGQFCERKDHPQELALIGMLIARVTGEWADSDQPVDIPFGMPCPHDSLWLLNLLATGCVDIWEELKGVMPPTWVELLRAVRYRREREEAYESAMVQPQGTTFPDQQGHASLDEGLQTRLLLAQGGHERIRISILNGFAVEYAGEHMPEGAFERRRARDLMTLLALVPGHRIRRFRAIETLFQTDYYRGIRKLYEATGEVRKRLGELCQEEGNAIVADRTQGSIGFDSSLVVCDVDEFEQEARMALAEDGDDFYVLEHARKMERIYGSGPDEHLAALGEQVVQRVEDLKTLYVDGAVAAGEAALRLGKTKLAVRYGTDAHRTRDLREDAMILLVRALKAAGRGYEIVGLYKQFSQHLIEVKGVPPSLALRRVVEQAIGNGPDSFSG